MTAANRETARDEIVTLLSGALVGAGLPAKSVIGCAPGADYFGISPLVMVRSAGSMRDRVARKGLRVAFHFVVITRVVAVATGWTEAQAEDRLDLIDASIAQCIETFNSGSKTGMVQVLAQTARSKVETLTLSGVPYLEEVTPVGAVVFG